MSIPVSITVLDFQIGEFARDKRAAEGQRVLEKGMLKVDTTYS